MNAPVRDVKINGVTYRLQYRKCGKPGCKCNTGDGHGPYWYSYDGNSPAKYVGSKLPDWIASHLVLLKSSGKKIREIKMKIEKRRDDAYRIFSQARDELQMVQALEDGERVDSKALAKLGLAQFNGKGV